MGLGMVLPLLLVTSSSLGSTIPINSNHYTESRIVEIKDLFIEYPNMFSSIIDRSIIHNKESDTLVPVVQNCIENICSKIKELIGENEVNFSNENYARSYLNELRKTIDYENLLINDNILFDDVIKSILLYLSTIEFDNLFAFEERFVINVLLDNNLQLQEYALNTLLNWDNISNVEMLKKVRINNKYLNEDLQEFIEMFI